MNDAARHKACGRAALMFCIFLPLVSLFSEGLMTGLFYALDSAKAVAVLQGEFWGIWLRAVVLLLTPVLIFLCFLLEQLMIQHRQRVIERSDGLELLSSEQRREFYLRQRGAKLDTLDRTPWFLYFLLFGLSIVFIVFGIVNPQLFQKMQPLREDIKTYQAGDAAVYTGPLMQVERPIVNGFSANPDERFVYYKSEVGSLRCAAPLLGHTELMQLSYEVSYLPCTGTVLSISDADGVLRTSGEAPALTVPEGYWLYGDLPVPVCNEAEGYDTLSFAQQQLFDLLYSQVLNAKTGEEEAPTRSFYLPQPLKKEEFRAVLALYDASESFRKYPMYHYRTDDERIVRVAYCQRYGY